VDRGIRFIQLREKNFSDRDILIACEEIQTVIDGSNTKLIMNDRADLASLRDADGLHLGQDDLPLELAARFFNREGHIWGLSTHSVEQARVAWYHNPDYIGFGPLFSTPTKKNPDPVVGLDCLGALVKESPMPVVAIGGIFLQNLPDVLHAGARNVCLVRHFMECSHEDILLNRIDGVNTLLEANL
jgi:thiamine-phosphate pyrophosphorylase